MEFGQILNCFSFDTNDEYPAGYVLVTKENAEKLKEHGWYVNFHTDYYLNDLSVTQFGQTFGFGGWMNNLTAYVGNSEYSEEVKITSRKQLDNFLQLIESIHKFANNK